MRSVSRMNCSCWLQAGHPDQDGRQLRLLCTKLRSLYAGRGLLGACRDYGFSDMAVFWDWGSGFQKDPALWAEWMADQELYTMTDQQLRSVHQPRLARWSAVCADRLDGERMVIDRRAYESSRSKEHAAAFKRMLDHTMDLW